MGIESGPGGPAREVKKESYEKVFGREKRMWEDSKNGFALGLAIEMSDESARKEMSDFERFISKLDTTRLINYVLNTTELLAEIAHASGYGEAEDENNKESYRKAQMALLAKELYKRLSQEN